MIKNSNAKEFKLNLLFVYTRPLNYFPITKGNAIQIKSPNTFRVIYLWNQSEVNLEEIQCSDFWNGLADINRQEAHLKKIFKMRPRNSINRKIFYLVPVLGFSVP